MTTVRFYNLLEPTELTVKAVALTVMVYYRREVTISLGREAWGRVLETSMHSTSDASPSGNDDLLFYSFQLNI